MKSTNSGSSSKKKTKSTKVNSKKQQKVIDKDVMARRIQCLIRRFLARRRIRKVALEVWRRVYDPKFKRYFWFDTLHNASVWTKPRHLDIFSPEEVASAVRLQTIIRGFIHRMRARKLVNERYTRYYDAEKTAFYYFDKHNSRTIQTVSRWLERQNVAMPKEDTLLLQAQLKIKELERQLVMKEKEIKEIKQKRYEELEPLVIKDKVKRAENLTRSKNMDEWSTDDLAAWFTELKMEMYIPNLYSNRVDGKLFINLNEDEYVDMGVTNKFHIRKLQLILKSYKIRYHRKKERQRGELEVGEDGDDGEELLSEYSPSELSAILAAEDAQREGGEQSETSSEGGDSDFSEEDDERAETKEEMLKRQMDEENIHSEIIMRGDGVNFPLPGDIVRVKYTVMLPDPDDTGEWGAGAFAAIGGDGDGDMGGMGVTGGPSFASAGLGPGGSTSLAGAGSPTRGASSSKKGKGKQGGKILMSTKNTLERQWVEFVLGVGQCIYGFDRALPLMSIGERTKFLFSPQYAYGSEGLFPHIPPNTPLIFDITLLEFRPRSNWVKPLIQDLNTTWEKPYIKDLKLSLERFHQLQQTQKIAAILSASMLLNEGVDGSSLTDLPSVRNVGGRGGHHTNPMVSPNASMASPGGSIASGRTSFKM